MLVNSRAYVVKVDPQCGRDWAHFDFLRDVAFVLLLFGERAELLHFSGGWLNINLPCRRFVSANTCYDSSYLQKLENRPIMHGLELRSQDARLENEQPNFGGDAALPSRATDEFTERWDAARGLAAQLQSRGVDAGQVHILLNALLPSGWDSNAGICLGGDAAARFLREMGLLGSALFTTLFIDRVIEAQLSEAVESRTVTMALVSQGQGNGQTNVFRMQPATEDAQCSAEEDVAVFDEQASDPAICNLPTRTRPFSSTPGATETGRHFWQTEDQVSDH